jgi:NAD(P)-dependent dehydrogenase (short-subunit alcohol dehydrogenase family)
LRRRRCGSCGTRAGAGSCLSTWSEAGLGGGAVTTLAGKVALLTGATSGIEHATAETFGRAGADVVVTDLNDEAGEGVASGIRGQGRKARFLHLDVTREADWESVFATIRAEHGRLHVLVNNAGIA